MSNQDTLTQRKWVIIPDCFVTSVDFNSVLENGITSLRYSVDNTKTFIKYDSLQQPDFLSSITCLCATCGCTDGAWCMQGITEYSHSEILTILATTEWSRYE